MSVIFQHVDKAFQDVVVLQDFSFVFADGKRYCLMGPSGIGKTTILRLIAGLLRPDRGVVKAHGRTVSFVFQEDRLLPWCTAKENIALVSDDSTAAYYLHALGLSSFADAYPKTLSGGMKRRVAIGRALAAKSDIYLFDEPLKGLDEARKENIAALIAEKTKEQLCIFVSHDKEEAALFGAEIITLDGLPIQIINHQKS